MEGLLYFLAVALFLTCLFLVLRDKARKDRQGKIVLRKEPDTECDCGSPLFRLLQVDKPAFPDARNVWVYYSCLNDECPNFGKEGAIFYGKKSTDIIPLHWHRDKQLFAKNDPRIKIIA